MTAALAIIVKAVGLILLAVAMFSGLAAALDADLIPKADGVCAGVPLQSCFFTII